MATHRHTRPDAKLAHLPAEIRDALFAKLTEPQDDRVASDYPHGRPWTLDEARDWLLRTHGVACSLTTISDFRSRENLRRELARTDDEVKELQEWLLAQGAGLDARTVMEIGNLVFINRATRDGDIASYKAICQLILKKEENQIDREKWDEAKADKERLRELEGKARTLKAAGGLSAETLELLEKELKLL